MLEEEPPHGLQDAHEHILIALGFLPEQQRHFLGHGHTVRPLGERPLRLLVAEGELGPRRQVGEDLPPILADRLRHVGALLREGRLRRRPGDRSHFHRFKELTHIQPALHEAENRQQHGVLLRTCAEDREAEQRPPGNVEAPAHIGVHVAVEGVAHLPLQLSRKIAVEHVVRISLRREGDPHHPIGQTDKAGAQRRIPFDEHTERPIELERGDGPPEFEQRLHGTMLGHEGPRIEKPRLGRRQLMNGFQRLLGEQRVPEARLRAELRLDGRLLLLREPVRDIRAGIHNDSSQSKASQDILYTNMRFSCQLSQIAPLRFFPQVV